MSETCYTRLAENTGRKNSPENRNLSTIAQICRAVSSQLSHVSTVGKKLLNSNISSDLRRQWAEVRYIVGHVEEILLFNKFFSDCRYMASLRRLSPTKLCDGAQMAIFCVVFASCISSEPRAAHFRPAF